VASHILPRPPKATLKKLTALFRAFPALNPKVIPWLWPLRRKRRES
jgi:hypothetical protein